MASPEDKAMAELVAGCGAVAINAGDGGGGGGAAAEGAGLTEKEAAARRLRLHGPNVVLLSPHHLHGHQDPKMSCTLNQLMQAILSLLDDPEQAWSGIQVLEHHARFFVALKSMFLTTYIDTNGSKCCVIKGDPAKVAHQCACTKAVKERISMSMDKLVFDGYQTIAVGIGHQENSCWEFIALLPYRDDLRSDSADAVDSLIDLALDIRVLTESPLSITKQVCGKLGKLGMNVLPAHSVFESTRNNGDDHLNINGISDLMPEDSRDIIQRLRKLGYCCAMVGYEFLDHDAIGESDIGIS